MNSNNVYYVITTPKWFGGPYIHECRAGFGSNRDIAQAAKYPSVGAAREAIRVRNEKNSFDSDHPFSIVKVTETTIPGTTGRREVPLGTEGSKVALRFGVSAFAERVACNISNGILEWFRPIGRATLFASVSEALDVLQTNAAKMRSNPTGLDVHLVGILEETTPARVERTEEVVPEPVEPANFTRRVTIVGSSVIKEVAYAPAEKVLEVVFNDGKAYRYGEVEYHTFGTLISTESAGRFYSRAIRNRFPRVDQ